MIDQLWPKNRAIAADFEPTAVLGEGFYDKVEELSPQNEVQRSLKAQAQKMNIDLGQTRGWFLSR
jgi:hypothetical protein